jgi:6-phosphogluconolactonase
MRFDERMRNYLSLGALFAAMFCLPVPGSEYFVYIGTYTSGKSNSKGIYVGRFNTAAPKLSQVSLAAQTGNPSFLAVDPSHRFLYAVGETPGREEGTVSAYRIARKTGKLAFLNTVSARGRGPCHLSVDKTGRNVLIANYSSGSVAVFPIRQDGSLGEASAFVQHQGHVADPKRQGGPHAHCIETSPDNRFALATDLGLDKVFVYRFDAAEGTLAPNDPPFAELSPRSGPRHLAFHPNGKFTYVINEIASTVTVFSYNARRGILSTLQTVSTLPPDFHSENSTAEIQVHPSGKFLYGSNRGHDSIAVFRIDPLKGTLHLVEYVPTQGRTPRNFSIEPTGSYLLAANQDSGNIVVFRIDPRTGKLSATGDVVEVSAPVCVTFVPAG